MPREAADLLLLKEDFGARPEDPSSGLGIRMVMALAKDVKYIPALDMNNLMLIF
jgi:hypothetical protein